MFCCDCCCAKCWYDDGRGGSWRWSCQRQKTKSDGERNVYQGGIIMDEIPSRSREQWPQPLDEVKHTRMVTATTPPLVLLHQWRWYVHSSSSDNHKTMTRRSAPIDTGIHIGGETHRYRSHVCSVVAQETVGI